MKKIGILTYFSGVNPGTYLQALSVYRSVRKVYPNDFVEIINYRYFVDAKRPCFSSSSLRSLYNDFCKIRKYHICESQLPLSKNKLLSSNYQSAISFNIKQNYDVIYVGSDTTLELFRAPDDEITPFWLSEEVQAKKIFIAASARGTDFKDLSNSQKDKLTNALNSFDAISVRDEATKRLMNALIGTDKNIVKLSDPTFAFDIDYSYADIYVKSKKLDLVKRPLICLHLIRDMKHKDEFCKLLKNHGYTIASLRAARYVDILVNDLSPFEFAGIFKYFDVLLTNRFHDTVFSIKNDTPVITFPTAQYYQNANGESKHSSLLSDFGLLDTNFIPNINELSPNEIYQKIDLVRETMTLRRMEILKLKSIERQKIESFLFENKY